MSESRDRPRDEEDAQGAVCKGVKKEAKTTPSDHRSRAGGE